MADLTYKTFSGETNVVSQAEFNAMDLTSVPVGAIYKIAGEIEEYNKYRHSIALTVGEQKVYYYFISSQAESYTASTLPNQTETDGTVYVFLSNGYYSTLSGAVTRDGSTVKVSLHGIYSADGTAVSYYTLAATAVTSLTDTVTKV